MLLNEKIFKGYLDATTASSAGYTVAPVSFTFGTTGRYPIEPWKVWEKLADAQAFVMYEAADASAYKGMVLSVVNDTDDNNGLYIVNLVGADAANTDGTILSSAMTKIGVSGDISSLKETLTELIDNGDSDTLASAKSYTDTKIGNLDTSADVQAVSKTDATTTTGAVNTGAKLVFNGVKEENGVIKQGSLTTSLQLAPVATSGKIEDANVVTTVITASDTDKTIEVTGTTVEAQIQSLAKSIYAVEKELDEGDSDTLTAAKAYTDIEIDELDASDVQTVTKGTWTDALGRTDAVKLTLNGVGEKDGKIEKGSLTTEVKFAKVATTGLASDVKTTAIAASDTNKNIEVTGTTVEAQIQSLAKSIYSSESSLKELIDDGDSDVLASSKITISVDTSDKVKDAGNFAEYTISQGGTALSTKITIPGDTSLKSCVYIPEDVDGDSEAADHAGALMFTYLLANGEEDVVYVDLNEVITEAELSEWYKKQVTTSVTIGETKVATSGAVYSAINSAKTTLTTNYEAADATLKSGYEAADKKLQDEIDALGGDVSSLWAGSLTMGDLKDSDTETWSTTTKVGYLEAGTSIDDTWTVRDLLMKILFKEVWPTGSGTAPTITAFTVSTGVGTETITKGATKTYEVGTTISPSVSYSNVTMSGTGTVPSYSGTSTTNIAAGCTSSSASVTPGETKLTTVTSTTIKVTVPYSASTAVVQSNCGTMASGTNASKNITIAASSATATATINSRYKVWFGKVPFEYDSETGELEIGYDIKTDADVIKYLKDKGSTAWTTGSGTSTLVSGKVNTKSDTDDKGNVTQYYRYYCYCPATQMLTGTQSNNNALCHVATKQDYVLADGTTYKDYILFGWTTPDNEFDAVSLKNYSSTDYKDKTGI